MGRFARFIQSSLSPRPRPTAAGRLLRALAREGPTPRALGPALEGLRKHLGASSLAWVVPHGSTPVVAAAAGKPEAFGALARRQADGLATAARQGRAPLFLEAGARRVIRVLPIGYGERVGYVMALLPASHPLAQDEGRFRQALGSLRPALRLALALAEAPREAARRPVPASLGVEVALHRLRGALQSALLWVSVPPEAVVLADPGVFAEAVEGLLKRALARAAPGTPIRLRAHRVGDHWGFVAETPTPARGAPGPAPLAWAPKAAGAARLQGPDFETLLWPAAPKRAPAAERLAGRASRSVS